MFLSSMNDDASRNIPIYVFEIQQMFRRENVPIGTEYAMVAIADGLTKGTDLRMDLGRTVLSIIRREGGRINAMELLSLILTASANPVDPVPSVRIERAMHETLGFILEVRQQLENSDKGILSEGMDWKERLTSCSEPPIRVSPLEGPSLRRRGRVMLFLALCGMLGAFLLVGLSRHRQQATENAGAQTHTLPTSGWVNAPKSLAPVVSSAGGTKLLPSHNSQFRSNARVLKSLPSHTASSVAVGKDTSPIGESRLHSPSASANNAVFSASNSTIRPEEALSSPTRSKSAAAAGVSTAIVAAPIPISRPKPVAAPRGIVQSGSAGIMAANLIWSPTPAYPAAAIEANVEGEVTVNALVGKEGNVLSATVISGPPLLREAALKAVEQWQYHPYLISGKPAVKATMAIVEFELGHD